MTLKNIAYLSLSLLFLFSCSDDDISQIEKEEEKKVFKYEFTKHHFTHDITNASFPYRFFKPKEASETNKQYPLIISLHGTEYYVKFEKDFLDDEKTGYMALAWIEEENQKKTSCFCNSSSFTHRSMGKS